MQPIPPHVPRPYCTIFASHGDPGHRRPARGCATRMAVTSAAALLTTKSAFLPPLPSNRRPLWQRQSRSVVGSGLTPLLSSGVPPVLSSAALTPFFRTVRPEANAPSAARTPTYPTPCPKP